jgi:hypothetical protein
MNITEGDLIIVHWTDTEDDSSWERIDLVRLMKPPPAKHVGYFISEDDECIRGAYSVCGNDSDICVGRWIIPKSAILRIEKVRDDELDVV